METNHFLLWEADHGKVQINHEVDNPKPPGEYIRRLDKYKHIMPAELDELQKRPVCRYEMIRSLARRDAPCRVYLDNEGTVIYSAKDGNDRKVFDAPEWLAAMCSHIHTEQG